METLLKYWVIISFLLLWAVALTWYFIKNHFKVIALDKLLATLQDWVASFQRANNQKHEEFEQTLAANKEKEELARQLLQSQLEKKLLEDKQQTTEQFTKIFEKLNDFGNVMSKMNTSDEFIIKHLEQISNRQEKQDALNLQLFEKLANK